MRRGTVVGSSFCRHLRSLGDALVGGKKKRNSISKKIKNVARRKSGLLRAAGREAGIVPIGAKKCGAKNAWGGVKARE